jgi:hypothetical protein
MELTFSCFDDSVSAHLERDGLGSRVRLLKT